jgi:sulfite dehydrogenase (cytochrome) subunit B
MQTFRVLAILLFIGLFTLAYAIWGRAGRETSAAPAAPPPPVPVAQLAELKPVKNIELQYHEPDLPPGPGHDVFAAECVICHSPHYVLDQPAFPRKEWTAVVHKMVEGYGANLTPDQEKEIVNYLVYWHGKKDAPPQQTQNTK